MGSRSCYIGLLACICAAAFVSRCDAGKLKEVFRWRQLNFTYPSPEALSEALSTRHFVPANCVPVGVEAWQDKVFVTVPRWKSGVPASLTVLHRNATLDDPPLRPYPDWSWHNLTALEVDGDQRVIVSPFRVRADACGRLWVLDTGIADLLGGAATRVLRSPSLLVFDLSDDSLLRHIVFTPELVKEDSMFASVAVEVPTTPRGELDCNAAFAYAADLGAYGLVVHDWARGNSWRITHNYFHSDPLAGEYSVLGTEFQWTDGLFGLALSAPDTRRQRTLYFHPFSSTNEFAVPTSVLHEPDGAKDRFHAFRLLGSRGPRTQSCASFMDESSGILFYTQVNLNSVGCWNSQLFPNDYSPRTQGQVGPDNVTMVFPNDIKVDDNGTLWVLTDRMPLFMYSELDPVDVNFRVLAAPVATAVEGTVCSKDAPPTAAPSSAASTAAALAATWLAAATLASL